MNDDEAARLAADVQRLANAQQRTGDELSLDDLIEIRNAHVAAVKDMREAEERHIVARSTGDLEAARDAMQAAAEARERMLGSLQKLAGEQAWNAADPARWREPDREQWL